MNKIAGSALRQLCRKILKYKASGWTAATRPVRVATARHDRILARWPNAYVKGNS